MFGGRVRFSGYDGKLVDGIGMRTVVEAPDTEPAILELHDVVATPRLHALYDRDGAVIMDTSRVFFPFDLAGHPGIDRAIRTQIRKSGDRMPARIEVGEIDVVEEEMYFGGILMAHYGHLLTDGLSRLWALERYPGHRILCPKWHALERHDFGRTIMAALGLAPARRPLVPNRMLIRKLICPIASIQYAHRIFHQHARTAERVAAALNVAASGDGGRIYLSRARLDPAKRRQGDESALEARLERYGYVVVHPETLPLDQQIALFSGRRTIVGTRGSAFHTALLAPPGSRSTLGIVGWEAFDGHYLLIDGVKQHQAIHLNGATMVRDPVTRALDVTIDVERTLDLMRDEGLL